MHPLLKKDMVPLGGGLYQERRIFSDPELQGHIDDALRNVQHFRNGAVVKVRLTEDNVAAVMAARLGEHWSMGLVVEREHTGEFSGAAQVAFDW
jgi:hypothetical protein